MRVLLKGKRAGEKREEEEVVVMLCAVVVLLKSVHDIIEWTVKNKLIFLNYVLFFI